MCAKLYLQSLYSNVSQFAKKKSKVYWFCEGVIANWPEASKLGIVLFPILISVHLIKHLSQFHPVYLLKMNLERFEMFY